MNVDVARKIGWTWEDPPSRSWPGRWRHPNYPTAVWFTYTVDDLLAFVAARRPTSFHFGFAGTYDGFYVDWGDDAHHAPTLLEALEQAVLAVDP